MKTPNQHIRFLLSLLIIVASASNVRAQYSYNDVETVTASVQPVVNLTVIKNSTGSVNFNTSSAYINGVTIPNFNTYKVKSNVPWTMSISSTTAFFNASGSSASANMPSTVLGFTVGTLPTVYTISTASTQIASGSRGSDMVAGNTFNVNLLARPNYDYGPGIYTITLNYTLTAQ